VDISIFRIVTPRTNSSFWNHDLWEEGVVIYIYNMHIYIYAYAYYQLIHVLLIYLYRICIMHMHRIITLKKIDPDSVFFLYRKNARFSVG